MSAAPSSPHVAWGLRAGALALKAKAGSPKVAFGDVIDLAQLQLATLPDDGDAARAVIRFLARFDAAPTAAGDDLITFVCSWRDGAIRAEMARTEAALNEMCPVPASVREAMAARGEPLPLYDWQKRADAGFD